MRPHHAISESLPTRRSRLLARGLPGQGQVRLPASGTAWLLSPRGEDIPFAVYLLPFVASELEPELPASGVMAPAEEARVAVIAADVEVCTQDLDQQPFAQAFQAARNDLGPGGFFEWRGQSYHTRTQEEWQALSAPEQQAALNTWQEGIDRVHLLPASSVAGGLQSDDLAGLAGEFVLGGADLQVLVLDPGGWEEEELLLLPTEMVVDTVRMEAIDSLRNAEPFLAPPDAPDVDPLAETSEDLDPTDFML